MTGGLRLERIRLNCRDAGRLAAFYVEALGFTPAPNAALAGRRTRRLALGDCRLDLVETVGGRPYPGDVPGFDLRFQQFAVAVPEMAAAFGRLERVAGWRPISLAGPQPLPPASGGATAFKFRDPEGHPLELIRLPSDPPDCPARIDHSAISVSNTAASLAFYQALGLRLAGASRNHGPEQDRLDGFRNAVVEVSALASDPAQPPHVELLRYRMGSGPREQPAAPEDVAATRLIFTLAPAGELERLHTLLSRSGRVARDGDRLLVRDPDGHLLQIEAEPNPAAR